MDADETLSLKLIQKLELLERENLHLTQSLAQSSANEELLERKISSLDAALEQSHAEYNDLNETQRQQPQESPGMNDEMSPPQQALLQAPQHAPIPQQPPIPQSPQFQPTPALLRSSDLDSRHASPPAHPPSYAISPAVRPPSPPLKPSSPPPSSPPPATPPTAPSFMPWQSNGIKTQISEFASNLQLLENENAALKAMNAELQDANILQQAPPPAAPPAASSSQRVSSQGALATAIADKIRVETQVQEITTDMAILLAQQSALLAALEAKSRKLDVVTAAKSAAKADHERQLELFHDRLNLIAADLGAAQVSLAKSEQRTVADAVALTAANESLLAMKHEVERKRNAIDAMKTHAQEAAQSHATILIDKEEQLAAANKDVVKLNLQSEGSKKQIESLEGDREEGLVEKQKRIQLEENCEELLVVVEKQQRLLFELQSQKETLNQCLRETVMQSSRLQVYVPPVSAFTPPAANTTPTLNGVSSRRFSTLPV